MEALPILDFLLQLSNLTKQLCRANAAPTITSAQSCTEAGQSMIKFKCSFFKATEIDMSK